MIVAVLMLLLAEAQFSSAGCDVQQLTPCLSALTSNTNPSQLCCKRLNQQKPCFCQYLKNPSLKMYLNSPAAKKAAKTCKVDCLRVDGVLENRNLVYCASTRSKASVDSTSGNRVGMVWCWTLRRSGMESAVARRMQPTKTVPLPRAATALRES
nr:non-specific lipid-transfer protein 2-like [Ipomoea batatas]